MTVLLTVIMIGGGLFDVLSDKWEKMRERLNGAEKRVVTNMMAYEKGAEESVRRNGMVELAATQPSDLGLIRPALLADMKTVMVRALDDSKWKVRASACSALWKLSVSEARDKLLKVVAKDPMRFVRAQAALALSTVAGKGDGEATAVLCKALSSDGWSVVRRAAAEALSHIGDKRAFETLRKAADSDSYSTVRSEALDAAVRLGDRSQALKEVALKRLNDDYSRVRISACRAIAALGMSETAPKLVELLNDKKYPVRVAAGKALAAVATAAQQQAIFDALKATEDVGLLCTLIDTLDRIGTPEATAKIKEYVSHADRSVRWAATMALAGRGDADGLKMLEDYLRKHGSMRTRQMLALMRQRKIKHPKVLALLKKCASACDDESMKKEYEKTLKVLEAGD